MAESVKLNQNSRCNTCDTVPPTDQTVHCFVCSSVFHAYCEETRREDNLGTKSMVKTFGADSTKGNFVFFCDPCLTNLEKDLVETERQKVACLEKKVQGMENKLDQIMSLLQKPTQPPKFDSSWGDPQKLELVRAPPQNNKLVIKADANKNRNQNNRDSVEKSIMENKILVQKTYENKNGDLVLVCNSDINCNKLKEIVSTKNKDIVMTTPTATRASITIVGLQEEFTKKQVKEKIMMQNSLIYEFSEVNDIDNHFEIHAVRPLKNNPDKYQAFATVSMMLREVIARQGEKITVGLHSCKIYDRYHVKICNACQNFGHYFNECPTPDATICGKCGSHHHKTKDCDNLGTLECINCVRKGNSDNIAHTTSSHKCPVLCEQQDKVREKHLNLRRPHRTTHL